MAKKRTVENKPREYTKRQLSHFKKQQRRQKFILFGGIGIIAAIVLIIIAGWLFGEFMPNNRTFIKVYDTKLSASTVVDTLALIGSSQQSVDIQTQIEYILNALVQNELAIRAAEKLGITATNDEIKAEIKQGGMPDNKAARELAKTTVISTKVIKDYLTPQVPESGSQVSMNAFMVESDDIVPEVKRQLLSGDNFTALAEEYALNRASQDAKGFFDWHSESVMKTTVGSDIPVNWAFSADTKAGDISDAITDNASSKKVGYWLIKVRERYPEDGEAFADALLLSSKLEAEKVKPMLEATDNITALVDKYSQHSTSINGHGYMGQITDTNNISAAFYGYVINEDSEIGKWSDPIKDTDFWTKGGSWLVQILSKDNNRVYSTEDRDEMVNAKYIEWLNGLWTDTASAVTYNMTDEEKQWAIDQAKKEMAKAKSG